MDLHLPVGWAGMRGVVTLAAAFVIPEDTAAPRRAAADRVHRHGRHAVPAGALAAVAGPPAQGALARPRRPTPWPAPTCCTRPRRPGSPSSTSSRRTTPTASARRSATGCCAATTPPGSGSAPAPTRRPSEHLRPPAQADDRRRARAGAGDPRHRHGRRTRWSTRCSRCSTSRSRCSTTRAAERERVRAERRRREPRGRLRAPPQVRPPVEPDTPGECGDCLREGTNWVHLRMCVGCGHIACCDSSPQRHASAHYEETGHEVMRSAEPGEDWRWCFVRPADGLSGVLPASRTPARPSAAAPTGCRPGPRR